MLKNLTLAALACAALFALAGPVTAGPRCQKGPIRQFIADSRPGILIPKSPASSCSAPTSVQATIVRATVFQSAPATGSNCPGGRCPLPR